MAEHLSASELIINDDGSVYHINLHPQELADTVILVGDPERVSLVSQHFDHIRVKKHHREFIAHTGEYQGQELTVLSTGIGTDNIDIVINELDALKNIDLQNREIKANKSSLTLIRFGTSGALQADIPIGTMVASSHGFGLDCLMAFYQYQMDETQQGIIQAAEQQLGPLPIQPYCTSANSALLNQFKPITSSTGITVTSCGFYGPQGRQLRAKVSHPNLFEQLHQFQYQDLRFSNFEMETAAIYGLSHLLGHQALSINVIIANRINKQFVQSVPDALENAVGQLLAVLAKP